MDDGGLHAITWSYDRTSLMTWVRFYFYYYLDRWFPMHRPQSLTVVDSQAVFVFHVCKLSELCPSSFCFDFTLRRTLFMFFGVWLTFVFCVHLKYDSAPNVFEYGFQDRICQTGICLRKIPHHSLAYIFFFGSFEMHIFIWILKYSMTQS